jgi:hemoglobin-like flavoprotein
MSNRHLEFPCIKQIEISVKNRELRHLLNQPADYSSAPTDMASNDVLRNKMCPMATEKLSPLSKEQIAILKKTFRLLDQQRLANRFYDQLFERYPEVKPMFPPDLTELTTKLMSVFELTIYSFKEHEPGKYYLEAEILTPLRTLGKKHSEKGVQHIHYPIANKILLESMQQEAGYVFPEEAIEAWRLALLHLTNAMLNTESTATDAILFPTIRDSFQYIRKQLLKL